MRILFLSLYVPYPPNDGGRIRTWNILQQIAQRHEVTLGTFAKAGGDREPLAVLRKMCREVVTVEQPQLPARTLLHRIAGLFRHTPASLRQYRSLLLSNALRRWAGERAFDVVHVDQIYLAQYAPALHPLPTVLTHHNIESEAQRRELQITPPRSALRRLLNRLENLRWQHYEVASSRRFSALACVSERDATYFRRHAPLVPAIVVPNGVDTQHFQPSEQSCQNPVLLFTGRMDYSPNVDAITWFCDEILPQVQCEIPTTQLLIVGRDPAPEVLELSAHPNVQVTGAVPDVRPYFAQAAVHIVPLRFGAGTRLKILEAMALGTSIVSTTLGSEGLDLEPEQDLAIADSATEFARCTIDLLKSSSRRDRLSAQARRTAEARFDWSIIAREQERAYQSAISRGTHVSPD